MSKALKKRMRLLKKARPIQEVSERRLRFVCGQQFVCTVEEARRHVKER